LTKSLIKKKV